MEKTIRLNGYEFNYVEKGTGQTVIFIHGSASDYRTWSAQTEPFAREFHVVSFSRRFHWPNQKIKKDQDYAMQQHVTDLKALIKYFGNDPVHLICHSYGALLGIELVCSNPELINKLVLAEPPAIRLFVSNKPRPVELLKLLITRPVTAISIIKLGVTGLGPATRAAERGDMELALKLFGKAALGARKYEELTAERKAQALENLSAAELTGSGFLPIPITRLSKCTVPTLLLTGEISPQVFGKLADRLAQILPNTVRKEIPRASHIMHEDNPEAFNLAVLSFLKSTNSK